MVCVSQKMCYFVLALVVEEAPEMSSPHSYKKNLGVNPGGIIAPPNIKPPKTGEKLVKYTF